MTLTLSTGGTSDAFGFSDSSQHNRTSSSACSGRSPPRLAQELSSLFGPRPTSRTEDRGTGFPYTLPPSSPRPRRGAGGPGRSLTRASNVVAFHVLIDVVLTRVARTQGASRTSSPAARAAASSRVTSEMKRTSPGAWLNAAAMRA